MRAEEKWYRQKVDDAHRRIDLCFQKVRSQEGGSERFSDLSGRVRFLERAVREQDQIIQALTDELGYVIERVPGHWAIVEKEEDYE